MAIRAFADSARGKSVNSKRRHQSLGYKTLNHVYTTGQGGGAEIVDKWSGLPEPVSEAVEKPYYPKQTLKPALAIMHDFYTFFAASVESMRYKHDLRLMWAFVHSLCSVAEIFLTRPAFSPQPINEVIPETHGLFYCYSVQSQSYD